MELSLGEIIFNPVRGNDYKLLPSGFDILLLRSIEYLTMLKLIKTLIQPCGQISLDHEVPDNLLPFQGNPITDGASLHTILAFDALLWKKMLKKMFLKMLLKRVTLACS